MDDSSNQGSGSGDRKRSLGRYLKRFRSAFKPQASNKASKQDGTDVAEHTSGGRHLESAASFVTVTTIRTRTPDQRMRTPEPRSPSAGGRRTPSLRAITPDVPTIPEHYAPPVPRDSRTRPASRPSLLEASVSEGDLVARPIRDHIHGAGDTLARRPDVRLERSNSNLLPRSDPRDQRSIELFGRYGINLEPGDWAPANRPATMERVDKAIRMRVHYHCHKCEVALGPSKICIACGHKQCKKCIRFPIRRHRRASTGEHVEDENHHHHHHHSHSHPQQSPRRGTMPEMSQVQPLPQPEAEPKVSYESQTSWTTLSDVAEGSTRPTSSEVHRPSTSSSTSHRSILPLGRKQSRQLTSTLRQIQAQHYRPFNAIYVDRLCHVCGTTFIRSEQECINCSHQQCRKCPRTPPLPPGEGGGGMRQHSTSSMIGLAVSTPEEAPPRRERMWKKPRRRVRWTCDECSGLFSEKEKTCANCGHARCRHCTRDPPISISDAIEARTQPTALNTLQTRLATFAIIDSGAASRSLATVALPRTTPSPRPMPSTLFPSVPLAPIRPSSPLLDIDHHLLMSAE